MPSPSRAHARSVRRVGHGGTGAAGRGGSGPRRAVGRVASLSPDISSITLAMAGSDPPVSSLLGAASAPVETEAAPTSDSVSHGRRDLPSLTGLRWIAAFLVFWFHTAGWAVVVSPWWHLPQFGFTGVSFFFVLSGVVLTWSGRPGQSARQFYWRRFARIYPAHAVMTVFAIVMYLEVMPPYKPLWAGLLALVLLHAWPPIPVVNSAANGVSWSPSCEAFFYAVFPGLTRALSRRSRRGRIAFVAVVLGACSTAAVCGSFLAGG